METQDDYRREWPLLALGIVTRGAPGAGLRTTTGSRGRNVAIPQGDLALDAAGAEGGVGGQPSCLTPITPRLLPLDSWGRGLRMTARARDRPVAGLRWIRRGRRQLDDKDGGRSPACVTEDMGTAAPPLGS